MSDEFDGCECFWSQEYAMRRLLSLIRNGQSYCTDTECMDLISPNVNTGQNDISGNFTMMTMFIIFAVIMYMFRPNRLRASANEKPTRQRDNSNDEGPSGAPPPPTVG